MAALASVPSGMLLSWRVELSRGALISSLAPSGYVLANGGTAIRLLVHPYPIATLVSSPSHTKDLWCVC